MADEGLDLSICVRCAMSSDWPRALAEAPPSERESLCRLSRAEFLKSGLCVEGRCLAHRGFGHFHWSEPDAQGKCHPICEPGSWIYPWSGNHCVNEIMDLTKSYADRRLCSDFTELVEAEREK